MKIDLAKFGRTVDLDAYPVLNVVIAEVIPAPQFNSYIKLDGDGSGKRVHRGINPPSDLDYDILYEACNIHYQVVNEDGTKSARMSTFTDTSKIFPQHGNHSGKRATMTFQKVTLGDDAVNRKRDRMLQEELDERINAYVVAGDNKADATKKAKADIDTESESIRTSYNLRRCNVELDYNEAELVRKMELAKQLGVTVSI